jgi:hypothetical protein
MKGERFISLKKMEVLLHREPTISPRVTDKGSSSPTTAGTQVVGFLPHWILHPRDHRQLVYDGTGGPLVTPLRIGRWEIFGNTSMHRTSRREKFGSSCSSAMERCGDVVMCLLEAVKQKKGNYCMAVEAGRLTGPKAWVGYCPPAPHGFLRRIWQSLNTGQSCIAQGPFTPSGLVKGRIRMTSVDKNSRKRGSFFRISPTVSSPSGFPQPNFDTV